jgi:hypothetical protein
MDTATFMARQCELDRGAWAATKLFTVAGGQRNGGLAWPTVNNFG